MACPLPPELLDLIVDHLHNEPTTLRACCLVSKSWVPRTRRYLFARVVFVTPTCFIESWKLAFPHPSNPLAHYVRTLVFRGLDNCGFSTTALAAPGVSHWIRTFYRVEKLYLNFLWRNDYKVSFTQLHGFSFILKSIYLVHVSISLSKIFDLVCSFPLLEDLGLFAISPNSDTEEWNPPSTSPRLTGTLSINRTIHSVVRRLCDLPCGLHFSKIVVSRYNGLEDAASTMDLVSRCSDTLESLTISSHALDMPSFDFSKITRLKNVVLYCNGSTRWITTTIQTINLRSLQQITIDSRHPIPTEIEELNYQEWQELDRLLAQLWTSHSIRPRVAFGGKEEVDDVRAIASRLLPELTRRGVVDVVKYG